MSGRPSELDLGFYAGVHCALAVVRVHGQDSLFDEIVASVGEKALIAEGKRRGVMRWSGLSEYLKRKRANAAPWEVGE